MLCAFVYHVLLKSIHTPKPQRGKEYYIEGAKGNEASCTSQGFFIQVGTTSAFLNVSLAIYYYRIIRLGQTETRIKRTRIWLFLCPIIVGLTFAFAGIPFYDMV